jgi:outer membrane receptor protein involved in Fe transport
LLKTTGFDTQVNFETALPEALSIGTRNADLAVNVVWTHMITNETQQNPVSTIYDCAGLFGYPCDEFAGYPGSATYPNDRVTVTANYAAEPFAMHLMWRWIAGTDTANYLAAPFFGLDPDDIEPGAPSVSSKSYVDLGLGYAFSDNIYARLTVVNLFDTSPPMMTSSNASNNTDTGFYDVYGRSYMLQLSLEY